MLMAFTFIFTERDINVDDNADRCECWRRRVLCTYVGECDVDKRTSSSVVKPWAWRMISWSCSHKINKRRATAQCQILAWDQHNISNHRQSCGKMAVNQQKGGSDNEAKLRLRQSMLHHKNKSSLRIAPQVSYHQSNLTRETHSSARKQASKQASTTCKSDTWYLTLLIEAISDESRNISDYSRPSNTSTSLTWMSAGASLHVSSLWSPGWSPVSSLLPPITKHS